MVQTILKTSSTTSTTTSLSDDNDNEDTPTALTKNSNNNNNVNFALEVRKALLGDSFVILQRTPDGSQELKPNIDKELFSLAPNLEEAIRICQDEFEDEHLLSEKNVHALAVLNKRKGDYLSSSIWFEKELKMRMMLGANDERVAYVYNELGECYYNLGRYEHAISTFLDCMRITLLREEDMRLEVADILDKIANCHDNLCNYNEALEKFSEVKQIRMSLLGAESNAVMQTMLCIGKILLRKEEVKQALGLPGEDTEEVIGTFEEYARLQKQRPQSNARDGANICYAEGIVAKLRGQHDTALSLFKHALAMFETLFDGEHHETIASIHFDIGCVESAMGYWEAALSHFQTCLLQRRNLMGVHVDVAEALYEMASIYNHQGKTKFAIKCLRESDRILKAKLVNGNEKLASVLLDSAKLWKSLQCYRPAEENFEQALEQAIAIYGHEHELAASILLSLGELLQEMNQIQQALFCYDESITVRTKIFGPDSTSVAQVLYNKGVALLLNEEFNEASNCLNQALTIREEKLGPMDSDVGDTLNTIGFLHLRMGNWSGDEALEPLTRALGVRRAVGNLSKIASTLQNMASVYKKRNDLDSCIKIHVEILSLRLEEYGTNDARVATAWIKLGNMQMSAGRLNEATVSYKEALRIRTLLYSRHHVSVAEVLFKMGSLNLIQGNNCDAKQMFEEYMRIRAHEEECPDKEMARALKLMGELPNSSSETSESQDNWSAVLEIFEQMGHTERHPSMYTPRAK